MDNKSSSSLLRHPSCGRIVKCNDRGFGYVDCAGQLYFIHFSSHVTRNTKSMLDVEGKLCAFVIGGNPKKYIDGKPGWENNVVSWILLGELDVSITLNNYLEKRNAAFKEVDKDSIYSILSAEWYIKLWENKTGNLPKTNLKPDKLLTVFLENSLAKSYGIDELIRLLLAISKSPWYAKSEDFQDEVLQKFFKPTKWQHTAFFPGKNLKNLKENEYEDFWSVYGSKLFPYIINARTVAIDLELPDDSSPIFQFGWKSAKGADLVSNSKGLSTEELSTSLEVCLSGQEKPLIVGHNLLFWDWPILKKHKVPFPNSTHLWDTLITSWILEPWKSSHALIVKDNAHRADADANECYNLFKKQITRIKPCLSPSDFLLGFDIRKLIDELFEAPTLLTKVKGRIYPSDQYDQYSAPCLYPESHINEINWQKNCHLEFLSPENMLKDVVLSSDICKNIALKDQSIKAKLVSIIVSDAKRNGVEVRLSLLPQWLASDEFKANLRNAHQDYKKMIDGKTQVFYLAEDLFCLTQDKLNRFFEKEDFTVEYASSILLAWQKVCRKTFNTKQIRDMDADMIVKREKRSMLFTDKDGDISWLLYEPLGLGEKGDAWKMLINPPKFLAASLGVEAFSTQEEPNIEKWVCVPCWRDVEFRKLESDRVFVSSDTANRRLYLKEQINYILNLLKAVPKDTVLLVAMQWKKEAKKVQKDLIRLSYTSQHSNSPLRQLENIYNSGFRVQVCQYAELHKYINASNSLQIRIQVVIDEVPLYEWYALLNYVKFENDSVSGDSPNDFIGEDFDDEGNRDQLLYLQKKQQRMQVHIKSQDIHNVLSFFLIDWIQGILNINSPPALPIIILDIRLTCHNESRLAQLPQQDLAFYSIEELLEPDGIEIFYKICYPHDKRNDIPNDYETYRSFLKENWNYKDFRPGPQKLAIQRFIQTKRDILLKMPTGGGKSIIFHLPALLRSQYSGRLTVVVTPLRALMRDQVESLWKLNFIEAVDFLSGGRDAWINYDVYQGILDGRIKLVFVAPERFRVSKFLDVLERRRELDGGLEFIVFDEAHCVSEWGFEFRPDYLYTAKYVAERFKVLTLPGNPHRFLLTSATVTEMNRNDLEKELELGKIDSYENLPEGMPHPIQPYIFLETFELIEEDEVEYDEKFKKIIEVLERLDLGKSAVLVFVKRRKDCHRISVALNDYAKKPDSSLNNLLSSPFHAGLPDTVKQEAIDFLRNKIINVLVCTKAFGMGMDIPHLHACIHHRPPTYIEEYLQEVGRIGRDEVERISAGHENVTATLLYNQNDIERNQTLLHNKSVSPSDLHDFFGFCLEKCIAFEDIGKSVCIIPAKVQLSNDKKFDENQVNNSLFWLERMKAITLEGKHPPYLDLRLDIVKLKKLGNGNSQLSRVSKALLELVEESQDFINKVGRLAKKPKSRLEAETRFGRFVKGLLRGTIALVAPSRQNLPKFYESIADKQIYSADEITQKVISISTSELIYRTGEINLDKLFSSLLELSKVGSISVEKYFTIRKIEMSSTPDFWKLLNKALKLLNKPTSGRASTLPRKKFEDDLKVWYKEYLQKNTNISNINQQTKTISKLMTQQVDREVYRAINTSLKLMRFVDFEVQESLSAENAIVYIRQIPDSINYKLQRSLEYTIVAMQKLIKYLSEFEIPSSQKHDAIFKLRLTDVMAHMGSNMQMSKLIKLVKLVETSGFYGFENDLNDWVSIITLTKQEYLETHNPYFESKSIVHSTYNEMLEKYELQDLRAQAMILLVSMPAEKRKDFIDHYFQCESIEKLKLLLEDTIGDVEEDVLANNLMLQQLLGQVRKERYEKEIEKLNDNQLKVCRAAYNEVLLVNAGPGSGKTHVLMMRCANLIHEQRVKPAEILVLAFNRAVVHEIKDRISDLFRSLGYGSYTNKLDVSTFHSFALRHEKIKNLYDEEAIGEAVHHFAEALKSDEDFARSISRKYKAILVDEFQDMNEDFYSVVKSLLLHSIGGGGMVIGDDDQDILAWNRKEWQEKHNKPCPLEATQYFDKYRQDFSPEDHTLPLNYRSVPEIVERANRMITKASESIGFCRIKSEVNLDAFRTDNGTVTIPFYPDNLEDNIKEVIFGQEGDGENKSIAILCRTNRECRQVYECLVNEKELCTEGLELLGSEDFPLYQMRSTGAIMDICAKRDEWDFVDQNIWDNLLEEYKQLEYADISTSIEELNMVYNLIRHERDRPRMRDVIEFIQDMKTSHIERLKTKIGLQAHSAKIVVSTVHKVKGLQFDTVFIMPSSADFPLNVRNNEDKSLKVNAAEEARLLYVAITRACNQLYIGWNDREIQWFKSKVYKPTHEFHLSGLEGSPKEVNVSWPGQIKQVQSGLQEYIAKKVCVGDPLVLKGKDMWHEERIIGNISKDCQRKIKQAEGHPRVRVSNIIRYTCGNYYKEKYPDFWKKLDESIKDKGWFYTVLLRKG